MVTSIHAGGSSPLSRGIQHVGHGSDLFAGIIPALAGNRSLRTISAWIPWDHPRSRGEYRPSASVTVSENGSSPLSRGILVWCSGFPPRLGIIPALAGNTGWSCPAPRDHPDHPRSRGEYQRLWRLLVRVLGSSPLSRGIRYLSPQPYRILRIIPALAGNTPDLRIDPVRLKDHPRSRGEYGLHDHSRRVGHGSSPLSRGILPPCVSMITACGIIPALAGNTLVLRGLG